MVTVATKRYAGPIKRREQKRRLGNVDILVRGLANLAQQCLDFFFPGHVLCQRSLIENHLTRTYGTTPRT